MKKKRQLRPIWQVIFDVTKAIGALAILYVFTAVTFLLG